MPRAPRTSNAKSFIAPIACTLLLVLLIGAAASVNLHRLAAGADAGAAKAGHHMASLSEIKALMDKAREEKGQ
jgi:hypothetical protein